MAAASKLGIRSLSFARVGGRVAVLGIFLTASLVMPACIPSESSEANVQEDVPDEPVDGAQGCVRPADCELVASTCCDCPNFATFVGGESSDDCDTVVCTPPEPGEVLCPALEASCDEGVCVAVCSPIQTSRICQYGFVVDEAGCLLDECLGSPSSLDDAVGCRFDSDCVRVPADCCGCEQGGSDQAVVASNAGAFAESLNCEDSPQCPSIDVCDSAQEPACEAGRCVLRDKNSIVGGFCGTPEADTCVEGETCVLNAPGNRANSLGVGSCEPE